METVEKCLEADKTFSFFWMFVSLLFILYVLNFLSTDVVSLHVTILTKEALSWFIIIKFVCVLRCVVHFVDVCDECNVRFRLCSPAFCTYFIGYSVVKGNGTFMEVRRRLCLKYLLPSTQR